MVCFSGDLKYIGEINYREKYQCHAANLNSLIGRPLMSLLSKKPINESHQHLQMCMCFLCPNVYNINVEAIEDLGHRFVRLS